MKLLQRIFSPATTSPPHSLEAEAKTPAEAFQRIKDIVAKLRNPDGGCPWDLEQTHQTLKPYLIEETYEVVEAISRSSPQLPDELGDLLLQIMLHSQIASESGHFDIASVCNRISDKMIRRHPHVFGETNVTGTQQVLENWESIKQKELAPSTSILDGIPSTMPALLRAQRTGDKASRVGFDWINANDVVEKVREEIGELVEALQNPGHGSTAQEELGDLLFAVAQYARKLEFDSEDLLNKATDKFGARFRRLEELTQGKLRELSLEQQEALWQRVKQEEQMQHQQNGSQPHGAHVDFEYTAPHAQKVFVAGSFNEWRIDEYLLRKDAEGVWRLRLFLAPGRYEYRYIVDDSWQNDQRPVECIANRFGTMNCVIEVTAKSPAKKGALRSAVDSDRSSPA